VTNRPDQLARLERLDRTPWSSLKALAEIAGKWWLSVWVLTLLSGIISFGLTVANIATVPTGVWVGLLVAGLVLAPSIAFHTLRVQRDSCRAILDDKEVVKAVLQELETLRHEAAGLQVEGMSLPKPGFGEWVARVRDWRARTTTKLAELHPAEAGNFTTLGVYDVTFAKGTKIFSDQHEVELRNLIRRIDILGEIRDRWAAPSS
jgi:hypothetical protein